MKMIDIQGSDMTSYQTAKNNGNIADMSLDGQHLFLITTQKQLILFDILQQKKIGNYFNDFSLSVEDKVPNEKEFSCVTVGNDGLFVAIGGVSGNLYIIRS